MATTAAAEPPPAQAGDKQWFSLEADAVAAELGVDPKAGLSPAEATASTMPSEPRPSMRA